MIASVTVGRRNAGLVKKRTPSSIQTVNIKAVNAPTATVSESKSS